MRLIIIFISIISWTTSFGQNLKDEVDNLYNFKPSKLTKKEQETKVPALDNFWNKIKNDTTTFLPLLRNELNAIGHNPYFYYDGASLLLSLTNTKEDKTIVSNAISKCDISDISRKIYVKTLNSLANDGINVTNAAIKILEDENYSFFIAEHVLTFNQGYCLTYMLVPQKDKSYIDTLVSIFKDLKPTSQISVITTLWFEYSCKGDSLLKVITTDKRLEKSVREYAKQILSYNLSKDQQDYLKTLEKPQIESIRKLSLQRFSDEAIEELDMTTRLMRKENNCHQH